MEKGSQEDLIEQACVYLMEKTYPEGCTLNRKRQIRKRAEKLNIVNGELYYAPKDKQVAMCFFPLAVRFSVCMSVTSRQPFLPDGEVCARAQGAVKSSHSLSRRSDFRAHGREKNCGKD